MSGTFLVGARKGWGAEWFLVELGVVSVVVG